MIKRISKILLVLLLSICVVTGCDSDNSSSTAKKNKVKSASDVTKKKGTLICTREGEIEGGTGEFNYEINYNGENLTSIHSVEAVESSDSEVLKEYATSFKTIDSYYDGIEYYNARINSTSNKVTHTIDIDYEKIDIEALIKLEGEEDNIFENKKPKLEKYLELGKKMGVTCKEK